MGELSKRSSAENGISPKETVNALAQETVAIDPDVTIGRYSEVGGHGIPIMRIARIELASSDIVEILREKRAEGDDVYHIAPLVMMPGPDGDMRLGVSVAKAKKIDNGSITVGRAKGEIRNDGTPVELDADLTELGFQNYKNDQNGVARETHALVSREQLKVEIIDGKVIVTNLAQPNSDYPGMGKFTVERGIPSKADDTDITLKRGVPLPPPQTPPVEVVDAEMRTLGDEAMSAIADAYSETDDLVGRVDGDNKLVVEYASAQQPAVEAVADQDVIEGAARSAEQILEVQPVGAAEVESRGSAEERVEEAMSDAEKLYDALDGEDDEVAKKLQSVLRNWNALEAIDASNIVWTDELKDEIRRVADNKTHLQLSRQLVQKIESVQQAMYSNPSESVGMLGSFLQDQGARGMIDEIDKNFRGIRTIYKKEAVSEAIQSVIRSERQIDHAPGSSAKRRRENDLLVRIGGKSNLRRMREHMKDGETVTDYNARLLQEKADKAGEGHAREVNWLFGHSNDPSSVSEAVLHYQEQAENDLRTLKSRFQEMQGNANLLQDQRFMGSMTRLLADWADRTKLMNDAIARLAAVE